MRLMIKKQLQKINEMLTDITGTLMILAVAAMAILIILSVIVRNIFGFSLQWIVDVNRLIFVWMCFLGVAYVNDKDLFIRFDILDRRFSPAIHKVITLIRYIASLVLYIVMVGAGIQVCEFAKSQVFSTINVSTSWLYAAVIVAGVILTYQTCIKIFVLVTSPLTGSTISTPVKN